MRACVFQILPPPLTILEQHPSHLTDPSADLEWRLTYVGSADSEEYDQVLDSILLGPIVPGQYKFVLQVSRHSVLGPTFRALEVLVVICSFPRPEPSRLEGVALDVKHPRQCCKHRQE